MSLDLHPIMSKNTVSTETYNKYRQQSLLNKCLLKFIGLHVSLKALRLL
jgi:hypothetical protein